MIVNNGSLPSNLAKMDADQRNAPMLQQGKEGNIEAKADAIMIKLEGELV